MLGRDTKKFRCTGRFEAQLYRRGWHLVAGCDEAGRGALIGPVYAAAVILNPTRRIRGVDDSKKLTPEVRAELLRGQPLMEIRRVFRLLFRQQLLERRFLFRTSLQ